MLPGGAKFVVGVPLTVLLWVFLPCAGFELIRKRVKSSEKLKKVLVACLVVILVLAIMLVAKAVAPPYPP
jgi:predicted permease